jgi:hypothetical protein
VLGLFLSQKASLRMDVIMSPDRHPNIVPLGRGALYVNILSRLHDFYMTKDSTNTARVEISLAKTKAILRGGTFHRVQVLVNPDATYIEHCGLQYRVTHQKDTLGRVICLWERNRPE